MMALQEEEERRKAAELSKLRLRAKQPPPPVDCSEIWLRSWSYKLPRYGIDATAPLPEWALV